MTTTGLPAPLRGDGIRHVQHEGRTLYAAVDVVAALTNAGDAPGLWVHLKKQEPALRDICEAVVFPGEQQSLPAMGEALATDAVDLEGMLRLVQSISSPRAERLRRWLAQSARERLEEAENPELAVLRTRRLYEQKGYSRRWVDKRLRGVSARHELTGEWYKRGAKESDQFRALTNDLMRGSFGMEVEEYRRHKNLFKTGENLRDHMSDLELALTALGETVAVELHRERDSRSFDQLLSDARDAGDVVSRVRQEVEGRLGKPVVQAGNHRGWWAGSRRRHAAGGTVNSARRPGADATAAAAALPSPDAPATGEATVDTAAVHA